MAHALLPPSGASAWVVCSAWPSMQRAYPEAGEPSEAAREGTAAHWAGAEMLNGQMVVEGQIAPNGVVLTNELIDSADTWVRTFRAIIDRGTTRPVAAQVCGVELHIGPSFAAMNHGTPDTWYWDVNANTLHVVDFKNGFGIVDAENNWQLINYAELLRNHLKLPPTTRYHLTIVQPRAFHRDGPVRTWAIDSAALASHVERLALAAEDATAPNPTARPGPQCVHCNGRHACEALQRDAYRSADLARASLPLDLDAEAAGTELLLLRDALKRLEARADGIEQSLMAQISRGERSSKWLVESVPGNLKWTVDAETVRMIGDAAGVPLIKESPITPAQAIKAGVDAETISGFASRPVSKKLVPFTSSKVFKQFGD